MAFLPSGSKTAWQRVTQKRQCSKRAPPQRRKKRSPCFTLPWCPLSQGRLDLREALSGQGVALAGHPLVDSYLAEGTLLRPPGIAPLPRLYYYLYGNARSAGVEAFCDWVVDNVRNRPGPETGDRPFRPED